MLGKNMRQNLPIVVQIATKYSDQIGAEPLIQMLESFKVSTAMLCALHQTCLLDLCERACVCEYV